MKGRPQSLGQHQRHKLINNKAQAKIYWGRAVLKARSLLAADQVLDAMASYYRSMETADILLDTDPDNPRAELRYARTATELAWVYRLLGHHVSLSKLRNAMQHRLRFLKLSHCEYDLCHGIEEATQASPERVNHWFEGLLRLDQAAQPYAKAAKQGSGTGQSANVIALL